MNDNLIQIDAIEERQREVDEAKRWFAFEGGVFGDQSKKPMAVLVYSGGKKWQDGWTKGMQSYVHSLPSAQRRAFQEKHAKTFLTLPAECHERANRAAIRHSQAVESVKLIGPVLKDPGDDLPEEVRRAYGWEGARFPDEVMKLYRLRDDGTWAIPLQADPPSLFKATVEQITRLMGLRDFVNQVGGFHAQLEGEEEEPEEEAHENLENGSDAEGPGTI